MKPTKNKTKKLFRPLGEHRVWSQGEWFIKVPKNPQFFLDHTSDYIDQLQSNIQYIRTHFSDFLILPETIIQSDETHGYRITQRAVVGKPINMLALSKEDPLSHKLQALFDHNYALWQTTMQGLDFYGTDSVYAPHILHNLFVDTDGNIVLVDIGLLRGDAKNHVFRATSQLFFHTQNMLFTGSRQTVGAVLSLMNHIKQ